MITAKQSRPPVPARVILRWRRSVASRSGVSWEAEKRTVIFATNNMAFEVNVGVMGITYNHVKQVHNQVTVGERSSSMMNFKVNIFSIGLGVAFYL